MAATAEPLYHEVSLHMVGLLRYGRVFKGGCTPWDTQQTINILDTSNCGQASQQAAKSQISCAFGKLLAWRGFQHPRRLHEHLLCQIVMVPMFLISTLPSRCYVWVSYIVSTVFVDADKWKQEPTEASKRSNSGGEPLNANHWFILFAVEVCTASRQKKTVLSMGTY